jgi:hypothetical protein
MMWRGTFLVAAALAISAAAAAVGCARRVEPSGTVPLTVTSSDYVVRGEYRFVNRDRIDALTIENGRAIVNGPPADLAVDLPSSIDPARRVRHWALVTDAHVDGHRMITFTESEAVKDFSVELPEGDAAVHFAAFASRTGGDEILVFASGDRRTGSPSLVGHVTIHPKQKQE